MSSIFSLSQLGWRACFAQQLTLSDLESCYPARVVDVQRSELGVRSELGEQRITLRPALARALTVGDWALLEREAPRVWRVLERQSCFERVAAGEKRQLQAVAANIDTLFIVTSCNEEFNPSRLERYLVLARDAGIAPVLVLTKADLTKDVESYLEAARDLGLEASPLAVDATSCHAAAALQPWLQRGQTVAFVGSSGVGKSTLVNTLLGVEQQMTRGIREQDGKGRHTTTARSMFALPGGAWVIDTPGMRELRLGAVESGVSAVFDDLEALARRCRFRDCRHSGDEGCAVAAAVHGGVLEQRRLTNYLKLQREAANAAQSVRERRERERHFGRLHRSAQRLQRRQKGQER